MNSLYSKYVDRKQVTEITNGIVKDIIRGQLAGKDFKVLVDELDKNSLLNNAVIPRIPDTEWDKEYLEQLADEVVRRVFSRQYLLYLGEVAAHVNKMGGKKFAAINYIIIAMFVIAGIAALVWIINMFGNN
jgi:hypothetical protein